VVANTIARTTLARSLALVDEDISVIIEMLQDVQMSTNAPWRTVGAAKIVSTLKAAIFAHAAMITLSVLIRRLAFVSHPINY
jgi:hypothetical protein